MTLSPEHSPVLRGADLAALPLATMIVSEQVSNGALDDADVVEPADVGPSTDELIADAFQAGFDEGAAAAEAAIRSSLQTTVNSLDVATRDLVRARAVWEEAGPLQTVGIALEIAEMILMREVAAANDPGRDAIVRCLSEMNPNERATIRLNPDDMSRLGSFDDLLVDRTFELVPDAAIVSGDAVADTPNGSIDARLRGALGRVREELLR